MPKMKTRKSASKRVKRTGTGKYLYNRAGNRHLRRKKSSKRKRRLGQSRVMKASENSRLKACLP